ncbi:MAG: hypothetical protein GY870_03140 [archaeon]|nr:hypothetical protein [archaeon]
MLELGLSKVTITPPLGTPLGGYEDRRFNAIGIHDDIYARCMLFRDTDTDIHIALIVCELLWVNYGFTDEIKKMIEELTRGVVKAENVIIHAIHTHSSQRIIGGLDFYYKKIKKKHNIDKGWYVEKGVPYLQRVIASSVYGALQDLKPVIIKYNLGKTEAGFNRREGDEASKIVDQELFSLLFLKTDDKVVNTNIRGIFYNTAVHCVTLGQENYYISADWPFFTAQKLIKHYDLDWKTQIIFGQGTAGNTNPINCKFGNEVREINDAMEIGEQIADDVISSLTVENSNIIVTKDNKVDLQRLTKTISVKITEPDKIKMFKQLNLWWLGIEKQDDDINLSIRINLIKINNLIIVTIPGEPFGEFGVEIKKVIRSINNKFQPIVLELTDGAIGYITTRDSFYNAKGYEASLSGSAETGYEIINAVKDLMKELGGN